MIRSLSVGLTLFALLVVPAFARAEEAADVPMPQLDPTHYVSQLFWLLICGVTLYVLMARVALPRVSTMIDRRDDQVREDLELAYKLKQQAEEIKVSYTKALRDADDRAKALIEGAVHDFRTESEKELIATVDRLQEKIQEVETYLRGEKDVLLADLKVYASKLSGIILKELDTKRQAA